MSTPLRFFCLLLVCIAFIAIAGCRKTTLWSPDSKQLAVEVSGSLVLYDVAKGSTRTFVKGETKQHEALSPAWSPDSKRIAFLDARSDKDHGLTVSLVVLDLASGKREIVAKPAPAGTPNEDDPFSPVRDYGAIAWSPDGSHLAYVVSEAIGGTVWVVSASGGLPKCVSAPERQCALPAWLPEGKQLAYLAAPVGDDVEWIAEIVDRDGTNRRTLFKAPSGLQIAGGLQWSADGKSAGIILRETSCDENAPAGCQAHLVNPADGTSRMLTTVPADPWSVSFTPDLNSLVFLQDIDRADGGRVSTVAVLAPPYAEAKPLDHPAKYESPEMSIPLVSPDGRTVALMIRQDGRSLLGLRYLDGRGPADFAIGE